MNFEGQLYLLKVYCIQEYMKYTLIEQTHQSISILILITGNYIQEQYIKKDHVAVIKYNRKVTVRARFYQEETIEINISENKIIIPSTVYIINPITENLTNKIALSSDEA